MSDPQATCKTEGNVAVIVIDNPPVNALSIKVEQDIADCIESIRNNVDVRAVVITSATERYFVAGGDISEFPNYIQGGFGVIEEAVRKGHELYNLINYFPKPIIAAVEGMALGGGCELLLSCDICIASENATIGLPEVKLGLLPGSGGTQRLPRMVGRAKAKEMMFLGDPIKADEAFRIGLVNKVVPAGETLKEAINMAQKIAERPAASVQSIKQCVNRGMDTTLFEGLKIESDHIVRAFQTEDIKEGVQAFLEKRKPKFKHK